MHILSPERKESFNKMLIALPKDILDLIKTLPGGAPLQEYIDTLLHKDTPKKSAGEEKKHNAILQSALEESHPMMHYGMGMPAIDTDGFAQALASSLAQSNAQIIRELQNNQPSGDTTRPVGASNHPVKLVADESFTKIISEALAEAIANSEQKRREDNRAITNSFLELQENMTKMMEQNAQLKYISSGEASPEAVAGFQLKNIVDDIMRAQSKFLRENAQNQKEELSSLISTAIKESQKLSTQSLIESFKKLGEENTPAPITYTSGSSAKRNAVEASVEEAIKAQGKEFSSIISNAIKESQKHSTQTIVETLEEMKNKNLAAVAGGNGTALNVEEIIKMQANLFRDITRAQNQEFSSLISNALKESQKQSTMAIISALRQVAAPGTTPSYGGAYGSYPQSAIWPDPSTGESEDEEDTEEENTLTSDSENQAATDGSGADGTQKKKKKKKKKKNNLQATDEAGIFTTQPAASVPAQTVEQLVSKQREIEAAAAPIQSISQLVSQLPEEQRPQPLKQPEPEPEPEPQPAPQPAPRKKTMPETILRLPEISNIVDREEKSDDDWGWGNNSESKPAAQTKPAVKQPEPQPAPVANAASASDDDGWEWGYADADNGTEGQDWEWEYEEVPAAGVEGQDWEWEYEEVPATGVEGQDWEWEYEEAPAEAAPAPVSVAQQIASVAPAVPDTPAPVTTMHEDLLATTKIVMEPLKFVLSGIDNGNFIDPYIEENTEMAV